MTPDQRLRQATREIENRIRRNEALLEPARAAGSNVTVLENRIAIYRECLTLLEPAPVAAAMPMPAGRPSFA